MNTNPTSRNRKGIALLMTIVAMAVITIILSVITAQILAQRQMVRQRHRQLQTEWLARAGVEFGAARLLENPTAFVDDKQELTPDSKLRIAVERAEADSFVVTSEAQVGLADGPVVVRTTTKRYRRSDNAGLIRLAVVAADKK